MDAGVQCSIWQLFYYRPRVFHLFRFSDSLAMNTPNKNTPRPVIRLVCPMEGITTHGAVLPKPPVVISEPPPVATGKKRA